MSLQLKLLLYAILFLYEKKHLQTIGSNWPYIVEQSLPSFKCSVRKNTWDILHFFWSVLSEQKVFILVHINWNQSTIEVSIREHLNEKLPNTIKWRCCVQCIIQIYWLKKLFLYKKIASPYSSTILLVLSLAYSIFV